MIEHVAARMDASPVRTRAREQRSLRRAHDDVGDQDIGTPPAMSEAIVAAIPGARLEVVPDASHLSNIEQADAFNRLLLNFLTE